MRFVLDGQYLKLDVPELPSIRPSKELEVINSFNVRTFAKISKNPSPAKWDSIFKPVHDFFDTLDNEQKETITLMFFSMKSIILTKIKQPAERIIDTITEILKELAVLLNEVDTQINMIPLIKDYVIKNIPLGDYSEVGTRPQDIAQYTFYREESIQLLTIAVLCKILTPIFGTIMQLFTSPQCRKEYDTTLKEIHTFNILEILLRNRFNELHNKLFRYIEHLVDTGFNPNATASFHGSTVDAQTIKIYTCIFVRSFVNVDLFYKDSTGKQGNILRHICSVTRKALGTNRSNDNSNGPYQLRSETSSDWTESNTSVLEQEGASSTTRLDVVVIGQELIESALSDLIDHHNLSAIGIKNIAAYYKANPFKLTPINKILLAWSFGCVMRDVNVLWMQQNEIIYKLIATLQLILLQKQRLPLVSLLSARTSLRTNNDGAAEETSILLNYANCPSYQQLLQQFNIIGTALWVKELHSIIQYVVNTKHIYNLPDAWWEDMDENLNGKTIALDSNVGIMLMDTLHELLDEYSALSIFDTE